jgi:hypothetical protein
VAGRDRDEVVHSGGRFLVAFGDHGETGAAGAAFLDVAHGLFLARASFIMRNHRCALLQQCDGAVFQFRRVIALGVDVGDFLELESAFEGGGKLVSAADEKRMFVAGIMPGDGCNPVVVGDHAPDQIRQASISRASWIPSSRENRDRGRV